MATTVKTSEKLTLALLLLWALLGIFAFFWSLVCFGSNGTILEKFVGLLISVMFGPLYWIYLYYTGYCSFGKK
jgi:hypothetical protein